MADITYNKNDIIHGVDEMIISLPLLVALLTLTQPSEGNLILSRHNEERTALGVSPLLWDDELAWEASKHADTCEYEAPGVRPGIFKNVDFTYDEAFGLDLVNLWVNEKRYLLGDGKTCRGRGFCNHYLTMTHRDNTSVGCSDMKQCGNHNMLVCYYRRNPSCRDQCRGNDNVRTCVKKCRKSKLGKYFGSIIKSRIVPNHGRNILF